MLISAKIFCNLNTCKLLSAGAKKETPHLLFHRTAKGQKTKQDSSFPIAMNRLKARRKLRSQQLITEKDPTSKVQSYLMTLDHSHPEFTNEVMVNISYNRMVGEKRKKYTSRYLRLTLRALLSRCKACDSLVHLQPFLSLII